MFCPVCGSTIEDIVLSPNGGELFVGEEWSFSHETETYDTDIVVCECVSV